jgi:hypothetical protein
MKKLLMILSVAGLLSACDNKKADSESSLVVDPVEAAIESGLTVVSGMADEQAGSTFAYQTRAGKASIWELVLGPKAYAEVCSRAYFASCLNGVKTANYSACEISGSLRTITGNVSLNYSHMSCTLTSTGDSVTRTYDIQNNGPRGGIVSLSSAAAADYRGSSYGGGGKIEKTSAGWDVSILGRHNSLSYKGRTLFSTSVITLSPMSISGSLSRSSRT